MNMQKELRMLYTHVSEIRDGLEALAEESEREVTPMQVGFALGTACSDLDDVMHDLKILQQESRKMITSTVDEQIASMFETEYQIEDDDDDDDNDDLDENGMDAEDRDEMNRLLDKD
jgi:hypothetical protein